MSLISDNELVEITADAEKELNDAVYYYLGGHAERGNDAEIDAFLSRHPLNPQIASSVAEALYDRGEYRANIKQWKECMEMSAEESIAGISDSACIQLGMHYFEIENFDEAYKWCLRAADTFSIAEGALAVGEIHIIDETRRDAIQSAKYHIKAGRLLGESGCPIDFFYLDENKMPVNEKGQWIDFELLTVWLQELPKDKRDELLDLIKTTQAIEQAP